MEDFACRPAPLRYSGAVTRLTDLDPATLSPYLVQHIDNPVNWHVWGPEAFAEARERDLPVMLSVGYSACHWCHVMAHESFEDDSTATYMNQHFVTIKVDREERPDVDRIYMDAVQAMTGHGGWPMTVFMTQAAEPFFAGTYFPAQPRGAHPSFMTVMEAITDAWSHRRQELTNQAALLTQAATRGIPAAETLPGKAVVIAGVGALMGAFDEHNGGFGGAPKFPQAPNLELIIRHLALEPDGPEAERLTGILTKTLDRMADGGIYDHLGGGFARYAVDDIWLVPHFEKMLYDNALLSRIYLRAWQLTGRDKYRTVACETLDYLRRDMLDPVGALHSAEDADSEGVEGKFYVWSIEEFDTILGTDSELIADYFGVTPDGNFEGSNILHRPAPDLEVATRHGVTVEELRRRVADAKTKLMTVREGRVRPGRDDKIVASWNGLALTAFAEAGAVLDRRDYLHVAIGIAAFIQDRLTMADGTIARSWRGGATSVAGFCDDYGAAAIGYLTLYQATADPNWFLAADRALKHMIDWFAAPEGGFFATEEGSDLVARPMNLMDNPTPSDNALAAEAVMLLGALTGEASLDAAAAGVFKAAGVLMDQHPGATGQLLALLATWHHGIKQVAIVGEHDHAQTLARVVWERFRPECVVAIGEGSSSTGAVAVDIPLLRDRSAPPGGATAFVCRDFVCNLPVARADALRNQLDNG